MNIIIYRFVILLIILFIIILSRFLYLLLDDTYELKVINPYEIKNTLYSDKKIEICTTNNFDEEEYYNYISNIDKKILKLNTDLRIKEYEIIKNKYKIKMKDLKYSLNKIHNIYQYLTNVESMLDKIVHLEELNDRITFYYRYMNDNNYITIKDIPVVQISKHHHAVEYMYKYIKNKPGTILHVDTHADMNPIKNKREFFIDYIKSEKISKSQDMRFHKSISDIGGVLVPMLLPYEENNGIFWLTPDWVTEPYNSSIIRLAKNEKESYFYGGTCPKYTIKEDKDTCNGDDISLEFTTSNVRYAINKVDKISDNYILNIDLDYFVSYGSPSYGTEGNDAISHGRTILDTGYSLKNESVFSQKENELFNEKNLILKRIDNFLIFIKELKLKNKMPSLIIICDSTRVNYCNYNHKYMIHESEISHEFMPKYFSFWVHNIVLTNLKKILQL